MSMRFWRWGMVFLLMVVMGCGDTVVGSADSGPDPELDGGGGGDAVVDLSTLSDGAEAGSADGSGACPDVTVYAFETPPVSLTTHYQTQPSSFLTAMFAMETALGAIALYLEDGKTVKANASLQGFAALYQSTSEMVPQWASYFSQQPLTDLENAVKAGNLQQVEDATDAINNDVCSACHYPNRPAVWLKYYWPDFDSISLEEPTQQKKMLWGPYMEALGLHYAKAETYAVDGENEKAQQAVANLKASLTALEAGCQNCHGSEPRRYFISDDVTAHLDTASTELSKTTPSQGKVLTSLRSARDASCYPCHVLHTPASTVRRWWAGKGAQPANNCTSKDSYPLNRPPASLDQHYSGPTSAYLQRMQLLASQYGRLQVRLEDGDWAGLAATVTTFETEYNEAAKMVPEWNAFFPSTPIVALKAAASSKDQKAAAAALELVEQVCFKCHDVNRLAVWRKHHWFEFKHIAISDPVSQQSLSWKSFMYAMAHSFMAASTYLVEKDYVESQMHVDNLRKELSSLQSGCISCHGSEPRLYFVSSDVVAILDQIYDDLATPDPDVIALTKSLQEVGNKSCYGCHVVHTPAASIQAIGSW
jgi:cytochrome c556